MTKQFLVIIFFALSTCHPLYAAPAVHTSSVQKALVVVFGHEGGLQCDRNDPGNWTGGKVGNGRQGCTKFGIATNTYPNLDIRNLTIEQAGKLYERDFWKPLHLSELESQGLANEIFDTAVNCGVGTGGNIVLQLVNIFGPAHYKLNGKVNSEQIEWINKFTRKKSNRVTFYKALNVLQGERYLHIITHNPKMMRYSNSWFSRVGDR
jgi:lysozyme family protein